MNDDLISRQAVIDALEREKSLVERPITETRWFDFGLRKAQDVLSELPSAQPERKKGKWIYGEDEYGIDGYHCDKCGFFVPSFINYIEDYNFCPYCGAEMDEEKKK